MVHKTITIDVADGIKLHEAANIAREMENMDCSCELIYGDKRLNAKSQISIISAGIKKDRLVSGDPFYDISSSDSCPVFVRRCRSLTYCPRCIY